MSVVKLCSSVTSTTDLLWYIEEVFSLWAVSFFSHYLSVLGVREAKYHIVPVLSEYSVNSDRKAQM